jgi:hypothetical protein
MREFARGEAALEPLRAAAHAERFDRPLADGVLRAIAEWESGPSPASARFRNELRARVKKLLPPDPPDTPEKRSPRDATAAMYEPGQRGQWRPS